MTRQPSPSAREWVVALMTALWLHVLGIVIFIVLLTTQIFAAEEIDSEKKEPEPEQAEEITIEFAPVALVSPEAGEPLSLDVTPASVPQESEPELPEPEPDPSLSTVMVEEEGEAPEKADFMGAHSTTAASDATAKAGEKTTTALSGEEETNYDLKLRESQFQAGQDRGPQTAAQGQGDPGQGADQETIAPTEEAMPQEAEPQDSSEDQPQPDEFFDPPVTSGKLEDLIEKKKKPEIKSRPTPALEQTQQESSPRAGGQDIFQRKTANLGVITNRGTRSLNVDQTELGVYQSQVVSKIVPLWQAQNYLKRSYNLPGQVFFRFTVDKEGKVINIGLIKRDGASDTQWGVIINSIQQADLPPMSKKLQKERNGEPLEFALTFRYLSGP